MIDVDAKKSRPNGPQSMLWLRSAYGEELPETTKITTPPGGTHWYYLMQEGEPPVPFRPGWLPNVDIPWQVPVPPSAKLIKQKFQDSSMSKPDTAEIYIPYQWASIARPLPLAPAWLVADIRNRRKQPQGPIRGGGSQGHSAALPPTEEFIERGLGWCTGSRDFDCFRLASRLWSQYGDEATVVAFIYEAWKRTPPKDHPFSWQDAHHKVKQAERYWRAAVETIRRQAASLTGWF